MNKASWLSTVVLCLSAFTATAGPITHNPVVTDGGWDRAVTKAFSDPSALGLHLQALSPDQQNDLVLWNGSQDGARDEPVLWDGPGFNGAAGSVSSVPLAASAGAFAPGQSTAHTRGAPMADPLAFLMLSAALTACTYTLRRIRLSAGAACG